MKHELLIGLCSLICWIPGCAVDGFTESQDAEPRAAEITGYSEVEMAVAANGLIYHSSLNNLTNGLYTDEKVFRSDMAVAWANGFLKPGDVERNSNRITADGSVKLGSSGLSLKIRYPRGKVDAKASGSQWQSIFAKKDLKDLFVSYWVRPQPGMNFTKGGKLPGLGGDLIDPTTTNERDWSGKLMWREQGKLEFYMHVPAQDQGSDTGRDKRYAWTQGGSHARLTPGVWQHLEIHYKLNTPGKADGILEGWLNGALAGKQTGFRFSDPGNGLTGIHYFFFSTFYGGDQTYAPPSDQFMWFDEVTVAASRIGYSASFTR